MHDTCDVVAAVGIVVWHQFGDLPVLGVAAGDYDLDDDLIGLRLWDCDVLDGGLEAFGDNSFLHVWHFEMYISIVLIPCLKEFSSAGQDVALLRSRRYIRHRVELHMFVGQTSRNVLLGNDECGVDTRVDCRWQSRNVDSNPLLALPRPAES